MRSVVVFEGRGIAAAHHDVELIAKRMERHRGLPVEKRNQAIARALVGGAVENGIVGHEWVAGEIHLRDQASRECGAENREMYVGGAPGVVMVLPRIRAGLDGDEAIAPFGVGDSVAATGEIWVERRVVLIDGMCVAPGRVGLPDFHEGVRQRSTVLVGNAARDDDAFTDGFAVVLPGKIERFYIDEFFAEHRTRDFGKCLWKMHEWLGRCSFLR